MEWDRNYRDRAGWIAPAPMVFKAVGREDGKFTIVIELFAREFFALVAIMLVVENNRLFNQRHILADVVSGELMILQD